MGVVICAPHKDGLHDGSTQKQAVAFIRKLFEDDTLPGLHIEPIKGSVDSEVRHRPGQRHVPRGPLKVQSSAGEPHYIFGGVWPHDKANEIAERAVLKTNPVNGPPRAADRRQELGLDGPANPPVTPPPSATVKQQTGVQLASFLESV
jgi:hypothetical protein